VLEIWGMATFKSFTEILAWQKSRELSKSIFNLTTIGSFSKDFGLKDQINRASGSIMDNIAEGFERNSKNEFINALSYSKGSAGETLSQLYRALDRGHISKKEFEKLKSDTEEVCRMIGGFIGYLNVSEIRGNKFKNRV
jgi:four helix bundle protein